MAQYLIGIDAGTSVIKSALFHVSGRQIGLAAQPTAVLRPRPGWAEQDMNTLIDSVVATLQQLTVQHPRKCSRVAAVGISAQGDGTWLVNAQGDPVRPAILWLDARSAPIIDRWYADGTADRLFELTGTAPCVSLQSAQLRWLWENDRETWSQTAAVMHAGDWIFSRLTGLVTTELSQVGHTYFRRITELLHDDTFATAGIEPWLDRLPPLRNAWETPGTLSEAVASRTGLPAGTPVVGPLFDVGATAIGMGAINDGDVCTILGSAGIHQMILDNPSMKPWQVGYNIVMLPGHRWIRMLSSMTGTLNVDWFLEHIGLGRDFAQPADQFAYAESLVQATEIGSGGVTYLPFIDPAGERSPFVNARARASWFGLHAGLERKHMLRALYEGVAMAARHCYEAMPQSFETVRIAGGGANSEAWRQILADVSGKKVQRMEAPEGGALGAAVMAGTVSGVYPSLAEGVAMAVRPAATSEPNPGAQAQYEHVYRTYRALLDACMPLWQ